MCPKKRPIFYTSVTLDPVIALPAGEFFGFELRTLVYKGFSLAERTTESSFKLVIETGKCNQSIIN